VFIKTIKYYENTKCTLNKGNKKSAQLSCVEVLHVNVGFFCAIEMHRLKHQKIKSKADYINNHILNVLKYIFDIQLIIKLQSNFLNE
jgi:hypothetical protein